MAERIVVCLSEPALSENGIDFVTHVRGLMLRAKAFGATLCAWSADAVAFSFQTDDLEEAVGFVTGPDAEPLARAFRIAIVQGSLDILTSDAQIEPGWGPVLHQASELALLAKHGEVLIEKDTLHAHRIRLVTHGSRSSSPSLGLRAYVIDVRDPFHESDDGRADRLFENVWVGRENALSALQIAPGTLATVRAAAGYGASRLLMALAQQQRPAPFLLISPSGHRMEPLGALRRGLLRARALGSAPSLSESCQSTYLRITQAQGASLAACSELVEQWLTHASGQGLLLIDDVHDVDSPTLEVVTTALLGAEVPFRAVVRMGLDLALPAELAPLPPGPEVDLGPLTKQEAVKLVNEWTGNLLSVRDASHWASQGGGNPLALREIVAEALACGALIVGKDDAQPRTVPPPAVANAGPDAIISKRFQFVTPGSRAVLFALGVLGGEASLPQIDRILELCADIPVDLDLEVQRLSEYGWLIAPQPDWIACRSRTHIRVLLHALSETNQFAWYRAACTVVESNGGLLLAEAAWYAAEAHDRVRAHRLAMQAATIAKFAGLESACHDLEAFARTHDPTPRTRLDSDPYDLLARLPMAYSPGTPEEVFPAALADRGPKRPSRFTFPPVAAIDTDPVSAPPRPPLASDGQVLGPEDIFPFPPEPDKLDEPPVSALPSSHDEPTGDVSEITIADRGAFESSTELDPSYHEPTIPERSFLGFSSAHVGLSRERIEALAESIQGSARLVQRIQAIAMLHRGQQTEAVRILRNACEQARELPTLERSRSHLAFAIGLFEAQRPHDALIEAIEALARAREANHPKAEEACLSFLRLLYENQQHAGASMWLRSSI